MKCRNFEATLILVTAGAANAEFSVLHELEKVPADAFVVNAGGTGDLYKSGTTWTSTLAYFKSSVASQQYYVIFFM